MNRIEKKSKYQVRSGDDLPVAYNSALYLSNRQVSWLIASIILLSFFIFIAGYFFGQRKAVEHQIELTSIHGMLPPEGLEEQSSVAIAQAPVGNDLTGQELHTSKMYKAQLIGFGTMRAAHQFAERLQLKNIPVRVQERHSKTAQGKEVIWYQVTTELFNDKQELMAFVEHIQKEERLKDIRIVSC